MLTFLCLLMLRLLIPFSVLSYSLLLELIPKPSKDVALPEDYSYCFAIFSCLASITPVKVV